MAGTTIEFDPTAQETLRLIEDTTNKFFSSGRRGATNLT
jgi:hypothetical protein